MANLVSDVAVAAVGVAVAVAAVAVAAVADVVAVLLFLEKDWLLGLEAQMGVEVIPCWPQ